MEDKFIEFVKLIDKMMKIPNMTLSERETELIKEVLAQILDNNPNYGLKQKRHLKKCLMLQSTLWN